MTNFVLEDMYDKWFPDWDKSAQQDPPKRYRIYAKSDTDRLGLFTLAGTPFRCHLCFADDLWVLDNPNVFVCEHEPVAVGNGSIRQISSIATKLVREVEPID